MARLKLDENVPDAAATLLRKLGHEVDVVRSEGLSGAADDDVLAAARLNRRILITLDLEFADVIRHDPAESPGIVVLRPHEPLLELILAVVRSIGTLLSQEDIEGRLWIVDEARLRVWPGWPPP